MRSASMSFAIGATPVLAIGRSLGSLAKQLVLVLDRWQARRQALRQLYLLDARTLRDIGLDRIEINTVFLGGGSERRRRHGDD